MATKPICMMVLCLCFVVADAAAAGGDTIIDDFTDTFTALTVDSGSPTNSSGPTSGLLAAPFESADTRLVEFQHLGGGGTSTLDINDGGSGSLQVIAGASDTQLTVKLTYNFVPGSNTSVSLLEPNFGIGVLFPTQSKALEFDIVQIGIDDADSSFEYRDFTTSFNSLASSKSEGQAFAFYAQASTWSGVNFGQIEKIEYLFQTKSGSGRNFDIMQLNNVAAGVVPEPSTYLMFLTGMAGIAAYKKRKAEEKR